MIRYEINESGKLMLIQEIAGPLIYLDHWALRKLSEEPTLRAEFISSMRTARADLAISWLNIAEFSKLSSGSAHEVAESLVEELLPSVFFLETNPVTVWSNEDEQVQGRHQTPAHADVELLKQVASLRPSGLQQFTARGLFGYVHGSDLATSLAELTGSMLRHIDALRTQYASDALLRRSARSMPPEASHPKATRQLFRELITTLLVDPKLKLTPQHATDLLHCVVPLSYCDYVLLDAHWEAQVSRVKTKLQRGGRDYALASVFSERRHGLSRFFRALRGDA